MLAQLHKQFSVIGVVETWLKDETTEFVNISGYKFVSNHRKNKIGGGTGLYIQDSLEYKLCSDCIISDPETMESLFVEIQIPSGKNIIVGTIYRPPNQNVEAFLDKFSSIMSIISKDNKHCYLMGDFNLNLFQYENHIPTQEFMNTLFSHLFLPPINRPTRLTAHSATLIDNIFTNCPAQSVCNCILLNDISDHLPIISVFANEVMSKTTPEEVVFRNFSNVNQETFARRLNQVDWTNVLNDSGGPNESFSNFLSEYNSHFESCFPLKKVKRNKQIPQTPWISYGLLVSVRKKNKLYKQLVSKPSSARSEKYKAYKNKLNHLIRIAKRNYYESQFVRARNNIKDTWKLINEVINNKNTKQVLPSQFKIDGFDNIPMHIIKNSFKYISNPLLNLINLSFSKGIFPDQLKIAKLIPIFKADDSEIFSNYRPISLLTNFSKFFEKVMYNRLVDFAECFNILYHNQFGFRKGYSTSHALVHLVNSISSAIDRNEITVGVFLDLSKAFDTLNHEILFSKLEHYGIRGLTLQWIKSYFSNRKQFVQYRNISSPLQTIKCGVPQGSILGPLLFLFYINDLPNVSSIVKTILFADDTSLFYSDDNIHILNHTINNELLKFDCWMKANKLSVNIKKTNYVVFESRQKRINTDLSLSFNDQLLKKEHVVKFLGVYIDENLSWSEHIAYICKKISKSVGIIYRSRFCLLTNTK